MCIKGVFRFWVYSVNTTRRTLLYVYWVFLAIFVALLWSSRWVCSFTVFNNSYARNLKQNFPLDNMDPFETTYLKVLFRKLGVLFCFNSIWKQLKYLPNKSYQFALLTKYFIGFFHLLDLIISWVINHVTCNKFKCSHCLKYSLQSECCNFNQWEESNNRAHGL